MHPSTADDAQPNQPAAGGVELLPYRYTAGADARDDDPILSLVIDEAHAVVRRRLAGTAMTMVIPVAAFRGVGVRIGADLDQIHFELVHGDPGLTLPLGATATVEDAADRLNRWSKALGLPRLLIEADGSMTMFEGDRASAPAAAAARPAPTRSFRVHQGGRADLRR